MLTGQAKVDYQREYMRRRRAGLSKPPKAEREPTQSEIREAEYYFGGDRRGNHSRLGWKLFSGIDRDAPDHIVQGVRALREHRAGLKAKAKASKEAREFTLWSIGAHDEADANGWQYSRWPKRIFTCMFCDATSDKVKMSGNGISAICRDCARETIRILETNEQV